MTMLLICAIPVGLAVLLGLCMLDGEFIFGAVCMGGLAALFVYFVGGDILMSITGYHQVYERQNLVALSDERNQISGQFYFLGGGYIESDAAYTFYVDNGGGARELHQVAASGIQVYEDTTQPYVVWHKGEESDHPGVVWCVFHCNNNDVVEIHVPDGSIKPGITMGVSKP